MDIAHLARLSVSLPAELVRQLDDMIARRAKARGLSEADYMGGNLLGLEVTADDVAEAFVALAKAMKTTGAVITVDGGNIAAALR